MRFSVEYRGRIPSRGDLEEKAVIRRYLQGQLSALYKVTSLPVYAQLSRGNKQYDGSARYVAIIPLDWTCSVDIRLLRGIHTTGRIGTPDLDNLAKTLCDAISAPHCPVGVLPVPAGVDDIYCVALEDNQITEMHIIDDFHWDSTHSDDIAIITVTTRETPIDTAVALGGHSYSAYRKNVI